MVRAVYIPKEISFVLRVLIVCNTCGRNDAVVSVPAIKPITTTEFSGMHLLSNILICFTISKKPKMIDKEMSTVYSEYEYKNVDEIGRKLY
jgi:hypothetical protein